MVKWAAHGRKRGRISTVVFTRIYRKQFGATGEQPTYRGIDQGLIPRPGWRRLAGPWQAKMEVFMPQSEEDRARPRSGRALVIVAGALLCAAVLQPNLAYAAPHGGGGFRGGGLSGFHGGGFHGGGFHEGGLGGFRGGGFHGAFAGLHHHLGHPNGGHWDHAWHNGRYGWWWGGDGLGWTYYADPWWGYPDYGNYDYNQPYPSQSWYYCSAG